MKWAIALILALATMNLVASRVYNMGYTFDPDFGFIYHPGYTVYSSIEGNGSAHYVQHGIRRKKEWNPTEPAPIIVLGDSFTEAHQVSDDEVYTDLLEQALVKSGIHNQVLNLANSGNSAADYIASAPQVLSFFKPAWVVVQVMDDDFTSDAWQIGKRHFSSDASGKTLKIVSEPALENSQSKAMFLTLKNYFPLIGFTQRRIQCFIAGMKVDAPMFCAGRANSKNFLRDEKKNKKYPVDEEINLLKEAYGGRVTILLISRFNPNDPLTVPVSEQLIENLARDKNISFVSSRARYADLVVKRVAPFGFGNSGYNTGHMNRCGHQVTADVLSSEIVRLHNYDLF